MKRAALPLLAILALAGCGGDGDGEETTATRPATTATAPATATTERPELSRSRGAPRVETVAAGLETPWEIGFLPDGRALITERAGRVRMLLPDGELRTVGTVAVEATGEGGLL
ncbi:MAG: PQQ-dependent sugar dehydrogenase, partial [Actinomycetota bacterium]|nr:PQQ-dependent sugar dehydrogenase [Actinomycetota bacterium]